MARSKERLGGRSAVKAVVRSLGQGRTFAVEGSMRSRRKSITTLTLCARNARGALDIRGAAAVAGTADPF